MTHNIQVLVIEPTNKCDLDCEFCPRKNKTRELRFSTIKRLAEEIRALDKPIRSINLEGMGNPFEHTRIRDILELLVSMDFGVFVATNGLELKRRLAYYDDNTLKRINFGVYLDHPTEEENDRIMGAKAYKRTLEAFEYMTEKGIGFDMMPRIFPENYDKLDELVSICRHYGGNKLVQMEVFPLGKANKSEYILRDSMKEKAIKKIDELFRRGIPIHGTQIQFNKPFESCTYARNMRLFLNSGGYFSHCHFLASVKKTELLKYGEGGLEGTIRELDSRRLDFEREKTDKLGTLRFRRKTACPCSYCLFKHTGNIGW